MILMNRGIHKIKMISKTVFWALLAFFVLITIITIIQFSELQQRAALLASNICLSMISLASAYMFKIISNSETPFSIKIARWLKILAFLVFAKIYIPNLVAIIVNPSNGFVLLDETGILALITFGIIMCFAKIFEYGCTLQQQDDETL